MGNKIDILEKRECPSCHNKIHRYRLANILLPIEPFAHAIIEDAGKAGFDPPVYPAPYMPYYQMYQFVLSSECETCGNISFWKTSIEDIDLLCSDIMHEKDMGIIQTYNGASLRTYMDKTEINKLKEGLKNLVTLLEDKE